MTVIDVLKKSELFGGLTPDQLEKVAALAAEEAYKVGQIVVNQGDVAKKAYVLKSGKVLLQLKVEAGRSQRPHELYIDVITPGESYGWAAFLEGYTYTMSAICQEPSEMVAINGAALQQLMRKDPEMGYAVMSRVAGLIASRLGHTRRMLARALSLM